MAQVLEGPNGSTLSHNFHLLRVDQTTTLPEVVKNDGILIFRMFEINLTPLQGQSDNTSINLLNIGEDIMLHISLRRAQNAVIFNSCPKNGGWGQEEHIELQGRFPGSNTTIVIFNHPQMYQIIINGRTGHYFKKRTEGDIAKVRYGVNAGQAPIFSNAIALETFEDWAALVPGSRSSSAAAQSRAHSLLRTSG